MVGGMIDQQPPPESPRLWQPLVLAGVFALLGAWRAWKFQHKLTESPQPAVVWLGIDALLAMLFLGGTVLVLWLAFREHRKK
jgi:hypothetical protein